MLPTQYILILIVLSSWDWPWTFHCHGKITLQLWHQNWIRLATLLGQWNLYCQLIYWEWYTFLMLTQLCHMGSFFWGNTHSNKNIFKIQKRIIRIIANIGNRESCRQAFKELQILTLPSQ